MIHSVIIVGGGVVGVSAAYALAGAGFKVTLLEAREAAALETSFANGGLQHPSASQPWNGPGIGRHLFNSLFNPSSAMLLRWSSLPELAGWGMRFLANSRPARFEAATRANYLLAASSVERTHAWSDEEGVVYDRADRPTLTVFASESAMAGSLAVARMLEPLGLRFEVLDAAGAVRIEPAVAPIAGRIGAAIAYPDDSIGDAHKFSQALLARAEARGVAVRYRARCDRLLREKSKVIGAEVGGERLLADVVIVSAATASRRLIAPFGVLLPVRPAKGYSLTFDARGLSNPPRHVIADDASHIAVTPLGDRLRVAGTAEFAGENLSLDPRRIDHLARMVSRVLPELAARLNPADAAAWTALRPMSADGKPFIGATRVPGLWLNTGHGHLGWTQAAGSASLLTALMKGDPPPIDPLPFAPSRL